MPALLDKINTAKQSGYSESEILDYLDNQPDMQGKIKTARDSGYDDNEILGYLSKSDTKTTQTTGKQPEAAPPVSRETTGTPGEQPTTLRQAGNVVRDMVASVVNPEVGGTLAKAIPNIPKSAYEYGRNIAKAVMPSKESYYVPGGEAARGIANVATGAVQKLIPGEQEKEKYADAVGQFYKDRYGGIEQLKQTIINDPVGFAADLSTALTAGGGAIGQAGKITSMGKIAGIGKEMAGIGKAIEPISATIQLSKPLVKVGGSFASQLHGRFMTGAGAEATKKAFEANPEFIDALRGNITEQQIIDKSKSALRIMREDAKANYGKEFAKVKNYDKHLDISPVKQIFETDRLKRLLDPTKSSLGRDEIGALGNMKNLVNEWSDNSAFGLDSLKQALDDFYKGSSDTRVYDSIVNETRNTVKSELVKNIPAYEKMTKDYSKFLTLEEEMSRALSLGKKSMMDTTLRKLLSAMRENFEYRKELLNKLDEASGNKLIDQLAGYTMQSYLPKGLVGKLEVGSLGVMAYMQGLDPVLGTALLMSSQDFQVKCCIC